MTYAELEAHVKSKMSERRFVHSQGVAEACARLAGRYGADVERARLAGILHDVCKELPTDEQLKLIENCGILLSTAERNNPPLLHAPAGAAYVQQVLGVTDPEIVTAIRCHTGGKAGMTTLEKILFVADFISEDRTYPGVEQLREAAKDSLEAVIVEGIAYTVTERVEQRLLIEPASLDAYNEALLILIERKEQTKWKL